MGAKQSNRNNKEHSKHQNLSNENGAPTEIMTLEEVYESLDDYKEVINNVYCLNE